MTSAETGHTGEAIAAKYYLERGYTLLTHNYRTRQGELDLVLKKGSQVVICEVKTRSGKQLGTPAEAVNRAKQRRILLAARQFLQERALFSCYVQFDVVEVTPKGNGWQVHCIPNAFWDWKNSQ